MLLLRRNWKSIWPVRHVVQLSSEILCGRMQSCLK